MAKAINMPQVGQDLETAIITEWCVEENDKVNKGDIIAVVDSDKASFEVEAFESGTILKLLYKEGESATVFKPIAYIGEPGESVEDLLMMTPASEIEKQDVSEDETTSPEENLITRPGKILATPAVKRVARENQIDLKTILGSGPEGRIMKEDVFKEIERLKGQGKGETEEKDSEKLTRKEKVMPQEQITTEEGDKLIEFTRMRNAIARQLVASKQEIPHFYLFLDADVTDILQWRVEKNRDMEENLKISINDLLIYHVARNLKKFPEMNVHVSNSHLVIKQDINIGIAVSVEDGLIVPVLENADKKDLKAIHAESRDIIESARNGRLSVTAQSTFTISNLGMYSIEKFIPIINPPEGAILGVGKAIKKVVPGENHTTEVRDILALSLACDHRAIDGAIASRFLEALKAALEEAVLN